MRHKIIVGSFLAPEILEAGEALGQQFICPADLSLNVTGCMWYFDSDFGRWQFALVTPDLQKLSIQKAYIALHRFLDKVSPELKNPIDWQDVILLNDRCKTVNAIRAASEGKKENSHIRYAKHGGALTEEAYVYWLEPLGLNVKQS
jgi:hypothetical protein